ncbi:hypothetical protein MXAN_2341 [Myxococcus xanthus DK 1622]|uniref:Uncharacterized protein n=1 Tax=Myxococcus xanthus (strain DK1622) TaxID=246197 RepID=Q1D9W2_MYXXD|nr:hypothetical protein MXAN_2341 [Myxococcus xanthus DK 1622]
MHPRGTRSVKGALQTTEPLMRPLLRGNQLHPHEASILAMHLVRVALVVGKAMVLALLQRLDGGLLAQDVRTALDQLGEGAPHARALHGLTTHLQDALANLLDPVLVVVLAILQRVTGQSVRDVPDRLAIGLHGGDFAAQERVERLDVLVGARHRWPPWVTGESGLPQKVMPAAAWATRARLPAPFQGLRGRSSDGAVSRPPDGRASGRPPGWPSTAYRIKEDGLTRA